MSRSYIFGYEKDNPSYEFLKTRIFEEHSSSNNFEETIYTNNLDKAKNFFHDKLKEMSTEEIEELYKKVTQNLLFNIFTISDEVDVCVAFETMNNRGKPLSDLELLKNRLIYLSLKLQVDDFEKSELRRKINDCWKAIYHNLGRNKENPLQDDDFLNSHYWLYFVPPIEKNDETDAVSNLQRRRFFRKFRTRSHYSELLSKIFVPKQISETEDQPAAIGLSEIYEYVKSLQTAVTSWYRIFNPSRNLDASQVDHWLDKLNSK